MLNLTKCKAIVGALFLTIGSVSAQDIIVLNNNTADEIQAKVIEVTNSEVKYKKWTYQDGPTFAIATAKIFVIKYQNGEKQTFNAPTYQQATTTTPQKKRTPAQQTSAKQESNKQESVSSNKFQPEFVAGGYAGYTLGLGDYALDAINLGMKVRYRFNPYLAVGATAGTSLFYDIEETSGTVNITADAQGILPLSEKVSLYGEVGIGIGIGYGWCDTNYLIQVGPGIRIGRVSIAALYNKFGEGDGGMSFQIGFGF